MVRWECIEAAVAEEGLRALVIRSAGSEGIGGAAGGAKLGRGVSSSLFSVPLWLTESLLSCTESKSPRSLVSSTAELSFAAARRCRRAGFTGAAVRVDAGGFRPASALEDAAAGAMEGRAVLEVAAAGGRVDVLRLAPAGVGARLGRGFAPTPESGRFVAAGGVDVLDVDVLEGPARPSCFVGDLVGDLRPLVSLAAGVGVPGTALALRSGCVVCLLAPLTAL